MGKTVIGREALRQVGVADGTGRFSRGSGCGSRRAWVLLVLAGAAGGCGPGTGATGGAMRFEQSGEVRQPLIRYVSAVAVSADGRWALTGESVGGLALWDLREGKPVRDWKAHKGSGIVTCVTFLHHDPSRALSTGGGGLKLSDVRAGQEVRSFEPSADLCPNAIAVAPDDQTFVADGRREGDVSRMSLRRWSVADGRLLGQWDTPQGPSMKMAFEAGGERLIDLDMAGSAWVWDLGRRERAGGYSDNAPAYCGDITADGQHTLTVFEDRVSFREVATGKELWRFEVEGTALSSARVAPDGSVVVVAAGDALEVLDGATGRRLARAWVKRGPVRALAFCPDGKQVVAGGGRARPSPQADGFTVEDDRWLAVFSAATGKEVRSLTPDRIEYSGEKR
jgi:WD40 repeat protein